MKAEDRQEIDDTFVYFKGAWEAFRFDRYQKLAVSTKVYECIKLPDVVYFAIGLGGESGEVIDKIKKVYRDKDGVFGDAEREAIKLELGDVLWYVALTAHSLGIDLSDVALSNLKKLRDRHEKGTVAGSGDNR